MRKSFIEKTPKQLIKKLVHDSKGYETRFDKDSILSGDTDCSSDPCFATRKKSFKD